MIIEKIIYPSWGKYSTGLPSTILLLLKLYWSFFLLELIINQHCHLFVNFDIKLTLQLAYARKALGELVCSLHTSSNGVLS